MCRHDWLRRRARHLPAQRRATSAFFCARAAQFMVRRMLLAGFGAGVTDVRAEPAQRFRHRRKPAHPVHRQRANVRAFPAEADAAGHQFTVAVRVHADHVVAARVAHACAGLAGGDTGLVLLAHRSIVIMYGGSSLLPIRAKNRPIGRKQDEPRAARDRPIAQGLRNGVDAPSMQVADNLSSPAQDVLWIVYFERTTVETARLFLPIRQA